MIKMSQTLWTKFHLDSFKRATLQTQFVPSEPGHSEGGKTDGCPAAANFSWSKMHYVLLGLHLLLAFGASADDIYKEALHDSDYIPTCEMGHCCRARNLHIVQPAKWHDNTNPLLLFFVFFFLLHQGCFYIFASSCTVELLGLADETLLWKGWTSSFTPKGKHLIVALFSVTFQSVADTDTMENIWPVKTDVLFIM